MAVHGKVEVTCPHCQSTQMEPASGVSTYCRQCGGHFKLGQAPPAKGRLAGLMDRARGRSESAPARPAAPPRAPSVPLQITGHGEEGAQLVARASALGGARSTSGGLTKDPPRVVQCLECSATHKVAAASTSTICPGCSTYIDLRNLVIKDRTNQRIRTRGDVTVEKKGALLGTSIHCGNLTVYGSVSGSIHASGDFILKSDQKFIGEIRCRRFVLEKKCEAHCLQPVRAEEVEIHGRAIGHFFATRSITLHRHAVLDGSATAQSIKVEPGAVLNGQVFVQHPEPDPDPLSAGRLVPAAG
jgi:cytoskeletal protein CcmA (bactofilin family)